MLQLQQYVEGGHAGSKNRYRIRTRARCGPQLSRTDTTHGVENCWQHRMEQCSIVASRNDCRCYRLNRHVYEMGQIR
ncbi:hypothetical protein F443_22490 [Phytophthora nicotianae P1569]|nr:hypothetical protein F443_22490 [Phytophthora nicotianae P1569]